MNFRSAQALRQEPSNFTLAQSASTGGLIIRAAESFDELPESFEMFIGTVLAWRVKANASGFATRVGVLEPFANVIVSAHALPGRVEGLSSAFGADEYVQKFLGIGNVHLEAGAVVPVLTATLTVDHHAVIIWATADTVLSTIIAFFFGRGASLGSGSHAGACGVGRSIGGI